MYNHRRNIRGEGRFGSFVGIAIFVAVIYILIKIIPVFIAEYTFGERVREEALHAISQYGGTEETIRERMMKHAQAGNLPVRAEDVRVTIADKMVTIDVRYTVAIEFPGYTWHSTENPKYTANKY